jgi:hypothetical protein
MLGLQHKPMTPVSDTQPVNNDCKKSRQWHRLRLYPSKKSAVSRLH